MDCRRTKLVVVTCLAIAGLLSEAARAQRSTSARMAYNPVTGRTERDTRYQQRPVQPPVTPALHQASPLGDVEQASYCECGQQYCDDCCEPDFCGDVCCGDAACCDSVGCGVGVCAPRCWYTGFEATFLKPHFGGSGNLAFTTTDTTATTVTASETDFDYDLEFSPRVFVGWQRGCDVGFRATWWQFDHDAAPASGSPPASGTGEITHPGFLDVDISTEIPTDVFAAATDLNAYTIDLEATKMTDFCSWKFGMGCGFRYAHIEQGYLASLTDNTDTLLGTIDYRHSIEGFGPTVSFEALRQLNCRAGIFCKARGSILFGDSKSNLRGGEDLNLSVPVNTTATTASDDVLSICELQVGYRWSPAMADCRGWQPFYSVAMEGQLWDGAGNASSQDGAVGFFGFNSAIGINW